MSTEGFKPVRKKFSRGMNTDGPEITTVTTKGKITIPSRLRKQYGLETGTKIMIVPTELGLVLKKLDLPKVEAFQRRVEQRAGTVELSMKDVDTLVHEARVVDDEGGS